MNVSNNEHIEKEYKKKNINKNETKATTAKKREKSNVESVGKNKIEKVKYSLNACHWTTNIQSQDKRFLCIYHMNDTYMYYNVNEKRKKKKKKRKVGRKARGKETKRKLNNHFHLTNHIDKIRHLFAGFN